MCLGWKNLLSSSLHLAGFSWHIAFTSKAFSSKRPSMTTQSNVFPAVTFCLSCFIFHMALTLFDIFLVDCSLFMVCLPLLQSALWENKVFVLFVTYSQHLEQCLMHSKHSTNICQVKERLKKESMETQLRRSPRLTV